jgi:hypothetical protein
MVRIILSVQLATALSNPKRIQSKSGGSFFFQKSEALDSSKRLTIACYTLSAGSLLGVLLEPENGD